MEAQIGPPVPVLTEFLISHYNTAAANMCLSFLITWTAEQEVKKSLILSGKCVTYSWTYLEKVRDTFSEWQ